MVRILYLTATGPSEPTRASLPFHLAANGSAEVGQDADIVLAGDAAELVKAGIAEGVHGIGIPPLRELLAKIGDKGIPVHV
jgi:predicted peroxiredoxin